jgi:oligopeptide/dipeptide ABC transporter ATP-binding protein
MDPVLKVRDLWVSNGQLAAVRGVDLDVFVGQKLGLVGESGAGKSMFGLALMNLLPFGWIASGSAMLGDVDLVGISEKQHCEVRGRRVAMVFQDSLSALDPMKRIGWHFKRIIARSRPEQSDQWQDMSAEILDDLGVENSQTALRKYPHQLSGGQRQRILIGMAVAADPELIIADEPTTSVDTAIQRNVLDTLTAATNKLGASLVLVTHDLALVANYCDSVAVMYGGHLVESGPTRDVLLKPKHPYTGALINSNISLPRVMEQQVKTLPVIPGMMPSLESMPSGCAFRLRCDRASLACEEIPPVTSFEGRTLRCWNPN